MSLQSAIDDLKDRVLDAYDALAAKGATMPATKNTANMPSSIDTIVQLKGETKTITPTTSQQTITPSSGKNGITQVTVEPVTSTIDANILAGNIKKDIAILGVTGSYEGSGGLPGYNLIDNLESGQITYYMSDGTIETGNGNRSGVVAVTWPTLNYAHVYEGSVEVGGQYWSYPFVDNTACWILRTDTRISNESLCLLKGSLVKLFNNTYKCVEDITYDDELLVWDFDNRCFASSKPIWIKKREIGDYYFVNKYKSGKILNTTGRSKTGWGHRTFDLDKNKFVYTTESVSDRIFTLDGEDMHISCERIEDKCEFYNIITEKHFNLFANGILTSCSLNNLYPTKDMKYVKDNRALRDISDYDNIPQKWFDGLRLAENNTDIDKLNKYVKTLLEKNHV